MTKKTLDVCQSKLERITSNPTSINLVLEEWEKLDKQERSALAITALYLTKMPYLGHRLSREEFHWELEIINSLITPTKSFIDAELGRLTNSAQLTSLNHLTNAPLEKDFLSKKSDPISGEEFSSEKLESMSEDKLLSEKLDPISEDKLLSEKSEPINPIIDSFPDFTE